MATVCSCERRTTRGLLSGRIWAWGQHRLPCLGASSAVTLATQTKEPHPRHLGSAGSRCTALGLECWRSCWESSGVDTLMPRETPGKGWSQVPGVWSGGSLVTDELSGCRDRFAAGKPSWRLPLSGHVQSLFASGAPEVGQAEVVPAAAAVVSCDEWKRTRLTKQTRTQTEPSA